jgi:hypothetical protein
MGTSSAGAGGALDLSRRFLPEALAGLGTVRDLGVVDQRRLNQIRGVSYLHMFETFERALGTAARERSAADPEARAALGPLLDDDTFDHHDLFAAFEAEFFGAFPSAPRLVPPPSDLAQALAVASPYALLVLALHLKLVTQQHYLACVRGDERLEPHFVRLLRSHWEVECGLERTAGSVAALQRALARALPGRVPAVLRDYRLLVFVCDDVLRRQAVLDVDALGDARGAPLVGEQRANVLSAETVAHRKTFLTVGIVNVAFVYAMRSLGPTAPAVLAGIVAALSSR